MIASLYYQALFNCCVGKSKNVLGKLEGLQLIEHILETSTGAGDSANISAARELMKELGVARIPTKKRSGYQFSSSYRSFYLLLLKVFLVFRVSYHVIAKNSNPFGYLNFWYLTSVKIP